MPLLESPFESWRDLAKLGDAEAAAADEAVALAGRRSAALLQGRAHSAGLQFSVEVSGHVPVSLPESVQHSVVSGV